MAGGLVSVFLLYWLIYTMYLVEFHPYGWVPSVTGLVLQWCNHFLISLTTLSVKVYRMQRIPSSQVFKPLLLPSCLHIATVIALTHIPFQGWKNAAGPPIVQTAWILAFFVCLLVNTLFFNYKYQRLKLIGLAMIVIGHCVSIIGDFEADYLFVEIMFAFVYGLCYGILLPVLKQNMETASLLDIIFVVNFLAFTAISVSIPLLFSSTELTAVVTMPGFYWKLATLVPVESLYRVAVFYLIYHSSIEDFLVTVTAAWIPRTILAAFLYQLDYMISTLKGMFIVLFGCIIYWTSWQSQ